MKHNIIFGQHAVQATLAHNPHIVIELLISSNLVSKYQSIIQLAEKQNIKYHQVAKKKLDSLVGDGNSQGIVAKINNQPLAIEADLPSIVKKHKNPIIIALDQVTDPHNLGAILRVAAASGVCACIAPKDRSVSLTAVSRKVSSGGSEVVPFIQVSNLNRALKELKDLGMWVVGTDAESSQTIYQIDFTVPSVLVMGSEGDGLRDLTKKQCDFLAKIPMQTNVAVESLNVSVATGVCVFEIVRQRIN